MTLIQLLWVNLVMDTFAAIAYGGEPALDRYMKTTPIPRTAPIISADVHRPPRSAAALVSSAFSPQMWSSIVCNGLYIAAACIVFLTWTPVRDLYRSDDEAVFLTAFFCLFIFLTTFNSFNVRTSRLNLARNLLGNPMFLAIQVSATVERPGFRLLNLP